MIKSLQIVITLLCIVLSYSSVQGKKKEGIDIASNYNPASHIIHPLFYIYNLNSSESVLYIIYDNAEFKNQTLKINQSVSLYYTVTTIDAETGNEVKTRTKKFNFHFNETQQSFIDTLAVNSLLPVHNYLLKVEIKTYNNQDVNITFIPLFKTGDINKNDFLLYDKNEGTPLPLSILSDSINYIKTNNNSIQDLFLHYKDTIYPPALPAYKKRSIRSNDIVFDSVSKLTFDNAPCVLSLNKQGAYYCSPSLLEYKGFMIGKFYDSLFTINSANEMLDYIVYINRSINADSLKYTSIGPKLEVDKFWYFLCNKDIKKAKELIRIYYNRIMLANRYFSNFKEGWKTDMGMIFIIFGRPNKVLFTPEEVTWIYNNRFDSKEKLYFSFKRTATNYSTNHYILTNNEEIHTIWNTAITAWKSGKVFDYYNYYPFE